MRRFSKFWSWQRSGDLAGAITSKIGPNPPNPRTKKKTPKPPTPQPLPPPHPKPPPPQTNPKGSRNGIRGTVEGNPSPSKENWVRNAYGVLGVGKRGAV